MTSIGIVSVALCGPSEVGIVCSSTTICMSWVTWIWPVGSRVKSSSYSQLVSVVVQGTAPTC